VYGGVFKLGSGLVTAAGPLVVLGAMDVAGWTGWLLIGGVFVVAAVISRPVIRWAERTRPKSMEGENDSDKNSTAARTAGSR